MAVHGFKSQHFKGHKGTCVQKLITWTAASIIVCALSLEPLTISMTVDPDSWETKLSWELGRPARKLELTVGFSQGGRVFPGYALCCLKLTKAEEACKRDQLIEANNKTKFEERSKNATIFAHVQIHRSLMAGHRIPPSLQVVLGIL